MVLGFVSAVYCIFAFCLLLLLPFPQTCGSGEGVQGRKRRASTFTSPGWRDCYSTCLELGILGQSPFPDSSPRPKMRWLFFFFLHSGSCGWSLLGRCKRQWGHCDLRWRQGFPVCPANGGPSDLTLSTSTRYSSLQTLLPKPSTSAIVWIVQVPGGGLGIQASN